MLDCFLLEESLPFMGPAGKYREQRRQNAPALMLAGLMRRWKSLWGATQGLSVLGGVLPISSNGRYGGPYYGGKTDIVGGIRAGS
jgi:hypothetical protein